MHVLGLVAITGLEHTADNKQRAGSDELEVRISLLPKTQPDSEAVRSLSNILPVESTSDKTESNASSSATQASRLTPFQPDKLAQDNNLGTTQISAADTFDRKQLKRYFDATEVDQPALPIGDWNFFLNHLNPALTYTLQLEIYLSSDGTVDDWVVLKQEPLGDWVEQVVEKLKSTMVTPATKDGQSVNMVRNIEIFIKP